MIRAGFLLDLDRCTGCGACVLACRIQHGRSEGPSWRRLIRFNRGRWPDGPVWHLSVACHHCEDPACVTACPSRAYSIRADGAVILDPDRCLGCGYCLMACPFDAPAPDPASGLMTKCDFCAERTGDGLPPACVAACPMDALRTLDAAGMTLPPPESIPGFTDPSDCRPSLRLLPPEIGQRSRRLTRLEELLGP
jgi:anaerobic dimethyl sulfoxide reductase subunit B (iron-sulfur subunit)